MRRYHFLAPSPVRIPSKDIAEKRSLAERSMTLKPDAPVDSISLLIGAEADRERHPSSQIFARTREYLYKRLPHLFVEQEPSEAEDEDRGGDGEAGDSEDSGPGFLGRVHSYNKLMHAHTKTQLDSLHTGTLPSYNKTMHAFTLNQLNQYRRLSKSETNSPRLAPKRSLLHSKMCTELSRLNLEELPHGPSNTPEQGHYRLQNVHGIDFRRLRRRSLTEPSIARDFAKVKSRDVAAAVVQLTISSVYGHFLLR